MWKYLTNYRNNSWAVIFLHYCLKWYSCTALDEAQTQLHDKHILHMHIIIVSSTSVIQFSIVHSPIHHSFSISTPSMASKHPVNKEDPIVSQPQNASDPDSDSDGSERDDTVILVSV
jgi:hypothetical protein